MRFNELLVVEPGNQYPTPGEVAPFASLPTWWRRMIFRVLNPREFAVYMYLVMMMDAGNSIAYPLVESMRRDMGLHSDSAIFEALGSLERLGFIRRRRSALPNRSSRVTRNIYQRPAPEFTLLTLLKRAEREGEKGIDAFLNPITGPLKTAPSADEITAIPKDVLPGLKRLLGDDFDDYAHTEDVYKREVLIRLLEERLAERRRLGGEKNAANPPQLAPRDRQRQTAREREVGIAAAGGVALGGPVQPEPSFDDEVPF